MKRTYVLCPVCKRMFSFDDDGRFDAAVRGVQDHELDAALPHPAGDVWYLDLDSRDRLPV